MKTTVRVHFEFRKPPKRREIHLKTFTSEPGKSASYKVNKYIEKKRADGWELWELHYTGVEG